MHGQQNIKCLDNNGTSAHQYIMFVKTYVTRWSLLTTCFDRQAVIIRSNVEIQNSMRNCAPTWDPSGG